MITILVYSLLQPTGGDCPPTLPDPVPTFPGTVMDSPDMAPGHLGITGSSSFSSYPGQSLLKSSPGALVYRVWGCSAGRDKAAPLAHGEWWRLEGQERGCGRPRECPSTSTGWNCIMCLSFAGGILELNWEELQQNLLAFLYNKMQAGAPSCWSLFTV